MNNKKDKIEKLKEFVNSPIAAGSVLAGLNLCDIYLNVQDREYVLETIKYRFPNATENLNSAEDWFEKLSSLKSKDSYINAFVGQAAEYKSIERLEELGKSAEMFKSRIHPDNDIIDSDGIEWSVKSYSENDISNFNSVISEHPNATHYIINSELYEKLKLSGKLDEYTERGLTFLDGKFSHNEHLELASERINLISGDITDEVYDGVWDDVPVVAGIITLCNIGFNISKYSKNEVTEKEATVDIIRSISKLTVSGGGAAAGGAIGASFGSMVFPLVGTAIGGGAGALLGSIGARSLIDDYINSWKFKSSNSAYQYFSTKYCNEFTGEMITKIKQKYFFTNQIQKNILLEKKRLEKFSDELDLNKENEPTLEAIIVSETINKLNVAISKIESATKEIFNSLIDFCVDYGISKYPREREKSKQYAQYLYGAILAENSEWLLQLSTDEKSKIKAMKNELKKYPSNAFKLQISKEKLLGTLALLTLKNKGGNDE